MPHHPRRLHRCRGHVRRQRLQTTSFTTGTLAPGNHTITASYGGDGNFQSSTSTSGGTLDVTVPASTPGCAVTMAGSITAADGDRATFGGLAFTLRRGGPLGVVRYDDDGPAQQLQLVSPRIEALVRDSSYTQADLYGTARLARTTASFRGTLASGGQGATYRLLLSGGYDSGTRAARPRAPASPSAGTPGSGPARARQRQTAAVGGRRPTERPRPRARGATCTRRGMRGRGGTIW